MIARGVRDVKIFFAPTAAGATLDKLLGDTADFLRACLDGHYTVVDDIGDSHGLRA